MPATSKTETQIRSFPLWLGISSLGVAFVVLQQGADTDFPSPRRFHFFWTAFFALYGIALIVSAFGMNGLIRRWSLGFLIAYTMAGFAGCQSTVQRSSASVHVNTSWGSYNRRPPGGKIADDRANSKTFWFRALAFICWGAGVAFYFRPDGGFSSGSSEPNTPAQRLPSLPTESLLNGRLFDHDPRYPGCSQPDRDLSMALTAVTTHLRSSGFSDVTWTVQGETSYSCRAPDGRRFSFSAPPAIDTQMTACESGHKLRIYIKALRQPWNSMDLTQEESIVLQRIATNAPIYIGLVSVLPTVSDDSSCMKGFRLDFRGFYQLQSRQLAITRQKKARVPTAGPALSAMLYVTPTRRPVSALTPAPAVRTA